MSFKRLVFVADFFVEDYLGGSEKSLDAILRVAPDDYEIEKVHSKDFFPPDYNPTKDFIVLGNYVFLTQDRIEELSDRFQYAIIESDFKFCRYRLPEKHQIGTNVCACGKDPARAYLRDFYYKSQINFFKSFRHLAMHLDALDRLASCKNEILSVTYTPEDLAFLLNLRYKRTPFKKVFPWDKPVFGIYNSTNWIKGTEDAIAFCKAKKIKHRLINEKDDREFQVSLSKCDGFVFLPRGTESCSRMVVEAKIMGLELITNDYVGVMSDNFIRQPIQEIIEFLRGRPAFFWNKLKGVL